MAGSLSWIGGDSWPSDDGWPYADGDDDPFDPGADVDDDLVSLHALSPHLFDGLDAVERQVVTARFGLDGSPARSLKQLSRDTGLPRAELRTALGGGLSKLRIHLG